MTTVSGCNGVLNAHFHRAASLKYHVPDTWHDTTPSHIILTLGRPVLALSRKSECQASSSSTIFYDFGMSRPGIEPVTSRSPERTLYQLSYRGGCIPMEVNISTDTQTVVSHWKMCSEDSSVSLNDEYLQRIKFCLENNNVRNVNRDT